MSPPSVHAESVLIDAASHLAARVGRLLAPAPSRHGVRVLEDVPYGRHPDQRLDLWFPTGDGPHPVALYLHGGAFRVLSRETHWMMALSLARLGFLVANIDYRLAPEHPYPAGVQDALLAWQWLHESAPVHGGDPARMIVAGDSAGANLAAALTLATCWRREEPWAQAAFDAAPPPARVLAAYGIFQVSETHRYWQDRRLSWPFRRRVWSVPMDYLGERHAHHTPGWGDLADPLVFLERDPPPPDRPLPPFFIPVGSNDPLQADCTRMEAALRASGGEATCAVYPGARHGFNSLWWTATTRAMWHHAAHFLAPVRRTG